SIRLKKVSIFGLKSSFFSLSKNTSKENSLLFSFFEKCTVVMVLQLLSVKLMEGFSGIWSCFFPQYFTKAILLGDSQEQVPDANTLVYLRGIHSFSVMHEQFL